MALALMKRIAVMLVLLVGAADPCVADCAQEAAALERALAENPRAAAIQASQKGDYRFLSFGADALVVPAVADQQCALRAQESHSLVGTTDAPCSQQQARAVERAFQYATEYNLTVLKLRADNGRSTCRPR